LNFLKLKDVSLKSLNVSILVMSWYLRKERHIINKSKSRRGNHSSPPHKILFIEIELCYFFCFFNFNFQFHHLLLYLLRIEFHNIFYFAFYKIILILWPESWVLQVNLVDVGFLGHFCNWFSFFNFIFYHFGWLRIMFHNLF
jgi:hypothetical protein